MWWSGLVDGVTSHKGEFEFSLVLIDSIAAPRTSASTKAIKTTTANGENDNTPTINDNITDKHQTCQHQHH